MFIRDLYQLHLESKQFPKNKSGYMMSYEELVKDYEYHVRENQGLKRENDELLALYREFLEASAERFNMSYYQQCTGGKIDE